MIVNETCTSSTHISTLQQFPFYCLSNSEFHEVLRNYGNPKYDDIYNINNKLDHDIDNFALNDFGNFREVELCNFLKSVDTRN